MIQIRPLTQSDLEEASAMADLVFGEQESSPRNGYEASYNPDALSRLNSRNENKFRWFKYWVAVDDVTEKIIGTTGIYEEVSDSADACWLGWFCVDADYRRLGIGKQLLVFSMNEAKKLGKKYLRLFTTTNPRSDGAQALYDAVGFRIMTEKGTEPDGEFELFYREAQL